MSRVQLLFIKTTLIGILFSAHWAIGQEDPDYSHAYRTQFGKYTLIDTSLAMDGWHRQEPNLFDWFGYLPIGNQGAWRQEMVHTTHLNLGNSFGNPAFTNHFLDPNRWLYFKVRSAITEADYRQGYERGQLFRLSHTQNVHERLNFFIDFKRLNSLGKYQRQQVEQSDLLATIHYQSRGGKYSFHFGANTAFIKAEVNGGLTYDSVFTDNTLTDRSLVSVNFASSNTSQFLRHRQGMLDHSWHFINRSKDSANDSWLESLSFDHRIEYLRQSYVFEDVPNQTRPRTLLQSNLTSDSTALEKVQNNFGVSMKGKQGWSLSASIWNEAAAYEGENFRTVQSNSGLSAKADLVLFNKFPIRSTLNYVLQGQRQGGIEFFAQTGFESNQFSFLPFIRVKNAFPGFMDYRYTSNYMAWNRDYAIVQTGELGLAIKQSFIGSIDLKAHLLNNGVFYGLDSLPSQWNIAEQYFSTTWKGRYRLKNYLLVNTDFVWQTSSNNQPVFRMPEFYGRLSLSTRFSLFKGAINFQPGAVLTWFSPYKMRGYNPYTNLFYNQDEMEIGGYPLFDVFFNLQIRTARFYFKLEHLNSSISGYNYWAAPGYPLPDFVFRAGINWRFFN